MAPRGYQRVPTRPGRAREVGAATPLPLPLRLVLAAVVLCAGAYWWPVMNGTYRFLVAVFSVILWAQMSTGAWSQDAREFRRQTDAMQSREMRRAWSTFKEAAVGKNAVSINALGGRQSRTKDAALKPRQALAAVGPEG